MFSCEGPEYGGLPAFARRGDGTGTTLPHCTALLLIAHGSRRAEAIINVWDVYRGQFWRVAPRQASTAAEAHAGAPEVVEAPTPERVKAQTR